LRLAPFLFTVAALCAGHSASAATLLSLTYDNQTGTASSAETIAVTATLQNIGSEAFQVSDGSIVQGLDLSVFSAELASGFELADISQVVTTQFVGCGGTFDFWPCSEAPNDYNFRFGQGLPANLLLNPGESVSLDIGTLVPLAGSSAQGQYTISSIGLVSFAFNDALVPISFYNLAETCASGDPSCAFVRTVGVSAVPEPETWMMLLLGFGAIGAVMRRRGESARAVLS